MFLEGSPQNQGLFNHAKINFLPPTVSKDTFSLPMSRVYTLFNFVSRTIQTELGCGMAVQNIWRLYKHARDVPVIIPVSTEEVWLCLLQCFLYQMFVPSWLRSRRKRGSICIEKGSVYRIWAFIHVMMLLFGHSHTYLLATTFLWNAFLFVNAIHPNPFLLTQKLIQKERIIDLHRILAVYSHFNLFLDDAWEIFSFFHFPENTGVKERT